MLTGITTYLVSANDKLCELSYNSQTKTTKKKPFEQLLISGYDNRPVIVKMACQ